MRKLVFIIFVVTILFFVNIVFYIMSEDYRFFIKKIKYSDSVIYESKLSINDEDTSLSDIDLKELPPVSLTPEEETEEVDTDGLQFLSDIETTLDKQEEIILSSTEQEILDLFSEYDLKELKKHASLFDISTEYPDDYFEYFSKDLVVYFFSTKSYSEVFDVFEVLSFDLPYDLNEVNNFWQSSFYINLKEVYTDEFIRLVVQYQSKAFGLKIHRNVYDDIKDIIDPLKAKK